jgi:transcriptional regulator with XRE-family HTH domain
MPGFVKKAVDDGSIGDLLREKRLTSGLSLAAIEKATGVSAKYIEALEQNAFAKLPDYVYAKNFVRTLAKHYGLDPEPLARELGREMSAAGGRTIGLDRPANFIDGRRLAVTPTLLKTGAMGLVFLAIAGYFAFSVYRILQPPMLVVDTPLDSQVFQTGQITLVGRTEPEAELTINREAVLPGADGSFHDVLQLPEGVSILRIAAKKKHSQEREVYVKVIVEAATSTSVIPTPTVSATSTNKR